MYTTIRHYYWTEGDGELVDSTTWERKIYFSFKKAINEAIKKEKHHWRYKKYMESGDYLLIPSIRKEFEDTTYLRFQFIPKNLLDTWGRYGYSLKDLRSILKKDWAIGEFLTEYEIIDVGNLPIIK